MGSVTAAPWSIPYPTGTDRVADGDNAMQAIAERLNVTLGALPRGFLGGGGYSGGMTAISDNNFYTFPTVTFPTARDLLFVIRANQQTGATGTGIAYRIVDNAVPTTIYLEHPVILANFSFPAGIAEPIAVNNLAAGTYTFLFKGVGYGATTNAINLARCDLYDMGATGAI